MTSKKLLVQESGCFITCQLDDPFSIRVRQLKTILCESTYVDRQNEHFDANFCWPLQYKNELLAVLTERAKLKKAFDDSMGLVYQLNNMIAIQQ
jgi:hypothetical protein